MFVALLISFLSWQSLYNGFTQFSYTVENGAATITGYNGPDVAVTIPATIGGYSVARIGANAFNNKSKIPSITIPATVTSIGQYAFFYCTNLQSLTLPRYVNSIGGGAFRGCFGLTAINVDPLNSYFSSLGGVLFNWNRTTLIQYPLAKSGNYSVPSGVTNIATDAFYYCKGITEVAVTDSVIRIGDRAFDYCLSLTNVAFGNSVTSIGTNAFYYCPKLNSFSVDPLNPTFSASFGVLFDKAMTRLIACPQGKSGVYEVPNGVSRVESGAFRHCFTISSVTVPQTVISMGDAVFSMCYTLTNVSVLGSITNLANSIFSSCSILINFTIPNSVTRIGDDTFSGCGSLNHLIIPNGVTQIGNYAFAGCRNITNLTIPNSVNSLGIGAFAGVGLSSVAIPSGVTSIGDVTFSGCYNLTNITIPDSVTNIGIQVFYDCTNLVQITIPKSVVGMGNTFMRCINLENAFFEGNAPSLGVYSNSIFSSNNKATVYYLPGTTGWGATFGNRPTAIWKPKIQTSDSQFGVLTNQFGFDVTWASDKVLVVEAATDFENPIWTPVSTNTLTGGVSYFNDPQWTNYPSRFYRLRSP